MTRTKTAMNPMLGGALVLLTACQADRGDLTFGRQASLDPDAALDSASDAGAFDGSAAEGRGEPPLVVDGGADAGPSSTPSCGGAQADLIADVEVGDLVGAIVEGSSSATLELRLASRPCADVEVTIRPDEQLRFSLESLTFSRDDWDQPQTVTISAVHDFDIEGDHQGSLELSLTSEDRDYNNLGVPAKSIPIEDGAHVRLVSVALEPGEAANGLSNVSGVSDDGRFVAFLSEASNLVPGDTNEWTDVFLRDTVAERTSQVSTAADGGDSNGASTAARMSASGNEIVFTSGAANLVDPPGFSGELFLYERTSGDISVISSDCEGCGETLSAFVLSGSGTVAAYSTRRRLDGDTDSELDVFAYDFATGETTLASLNSAGENGSTAAGSNAWAYGISYDGNHLGISSIAFNLDTPEVVHRPAHAYVKDLQSGSLVRVNRHHGGEANCDEPGGHSYRAYAALGGNTVAYESDCAHDLASDQVPDTNGQRDIFVRNISEMTTRRLSVSTTGEQADAPSIMVGISQDARYVAFTSAATNLVPDDTNEATDVFVHDRLNGTTVRVSLDAHHQELQSGVSSVVMSWNGRFVAFSTADALTPADDNGDIADVYLVQLF